MSARVPWPKGTRLRTSKPMASAMRTIISKSGEVTNTKPDFEMIVRIADAMGFEVRSLVPFGGGTHADMGQTRGAQSGEADRHAVWLEAHNLEPKMTPFDPIAILDEIQR